MDTIKDSEYELAKNITNVLNKIIPQTEGYEPQVEIHGPERKKRSSASIDSFDPKFDEIRVTFNGKSINSIRSKQESSDDHPHRVSETQVKSKGIVTSRRELIKSLDDAETKRSGFEFIALKWFRDLFLPPEGQAKGYDWAESAESRDDALRTAIDDRVISTYKVANPKSPAFPVTAIRLNRQHPEVIQTLGKQKPVDSDFSPVKMRGEALSDTVLQERR